jgi:hypothetical protein
MTIRTLAATAALVALAGSVAIAAAPQTLTIEMKALNESGETGSAVLTQQSEGVKIVLDLKNAPKDAQPTHIHVGTCGKFKAAPEYALVNTLDGKSTTVLKGVTLDQLLKADYAINVHKSTSDLGTYVACGNIK